MPSITRLPFDVLDQVNSLLSARDFLALTSTCKYLRESLYDDSGYWRLATINTFRIRNRPSAENDGVLWRRLYRRLKTQSKIFTWGQSSTSGDPEQVDLGENGLVNAGIVSELQCGGWCTVFLNNRGDLYLKGRVDGDAFNPCGINLTFAQLTFPDDASEKSRSIRQFSVGRKHILGLADDGTTWLWYGAAPPAKKMEFIRDAIEDGERLRISRIMAGWSTSAMLVPGRGIVVWNYEAPFTIDGRENDMFMNNTYQFVPHSNQKDEGADSKAADTSHSNPQQEELALDRVGEVISFTLLEHFLLFCTSTGHLLVHKHGSEASIAVPGAHSVVDVQGSFRSFAVFTRDGTVLTAQQDALEELWATQTGRARESVVEFPFTRNPALQGTGVIQVAFGDYHFHALHSDGRITSYGVDPSGSGALGLGRLEGSLSARGLMKLSRWSHDSRLSERAAQEGRAVWLLADQQAWAKHVSSFMHDRPDIDDAQLGAISSWVERAGSGWGDGLPENEDSLGAAFALSVAAGGWNGCALVLVNESLVQAITRRIAAQMAAVSGNEEMYARGGAGKWQYLFARTASGLPDLSRSQSEDDITFDRLITER